MKEEEEEAVEAQEVRPETNEEDEDDLVVNTEQIEINFPGGNKYYGEVEGNTPHGLGTYTWATGGTYEGNWVYGKREG